MELPPVPVGVALDELPAAPPPSAGYGWNSVVPTPPPGSRRRSSGIPILIGVVAVVCSIVAAVMLLSGDMAMPISESTLYLLFALWFVSGIFWLWMLIDAISNSRVAWALAIFFLGTFAALAYALLGKTPRTAKY